MRRDKLVGWEQTLKDAERRGARPRNNREEADATDRPLPKRANGKDAALDARAQTTDARTALGGGASPRARPAARRAATTSAQRERQRASTSSTAFSETVERRRTGCARRTLARGGALTSGDV